MEKTGSTGQLLRAAECRGHSHLQGKHIIQLISSKVSLGQLAFHGHLSLKQSCVYSLQQKGVFLPVTNQKNILFQTIYMPAWSGMNRVSRLCCVQTVCDIIVLLKSRVSN